MRKTVLITDLDNTLFDWFGIWHASYSAMIASVCSISGVKRSDLLLEIKKIHQQHGTAEYAYLLESLPSLIKLYGSPDNVKAEMSGAIEAFRNARKDKLKLYKTVTSTLKQLKDVGVYIVAYTESKAYYASFRIRELGLDEFIDVLYSPPDHGLPDKKTKRTTFDFKHMIHKYTPENELKPNPRLLLDIIKDIGATPDWCVYIGDSEMKDIEMAQQANVDDVYARYGTTHFSTNNNDYDLLRAVTHWTEADVEREKHIKETRHNVPPSHSIDRFDEILNLFDFYKFKKLG